MITLAARDRGIKHLIVYAFSTENWNRTKEEVAHLMEIFEETTHEPFERLMREGVALRFAGQLERFSPQFQESMRNAEAKSPRDARITLWICLSYGGRAEIIHAARECVAAGEEITEESLARHLWTAGMPDPDIIIRPGGEKRLSNFLLWQSAYSEIFFIDTFWPDFSEADLDAVLDEYAHRERRRGR